MAEEFHWQRRGDARGSFSKETTEANSDEALLRRRKAGTLTSVVYLRLRRVGSARDCPRPMDAATVLIPVL
jgi:hypothetical protein